MTIAVLPGLPHSAEAARRIREAGKDVILHQPMESLGGRNPGPGALFTGMNEAEIRVIVNTNLDEVWPVSGMNNHEGSRVTMDSEIMEIVLDICRERGIVFIDSKTIAGSAVPATASRKGMQIIERDVFLDNEPDRDSILYYAGQGFAVAEKKGISVMIGHAHTAELAIILNEIYQQLPPGFTLSTVSGISGGE